MPVHGPNNFTAAAGAWTNPANALTDDGQHATIAVTNGASGWIRLTNPAFSIPGDEVIDGIDIDYEAILSTGFGDPPYLEFALTKDGTNPTGTVQETAGGPADLWGTTWNSSELNTGTAGVLIRLVDPTTEGATANLDVATITVYTTEDPELVPIEGGVGGGSGGGNVGGGHEMDGAMLIIPAIGKEVM